MFDGKNKALTFSYDDGVSQDVRLINILNKYGLKGTFNLNSDKLGTVHNGNPFCKPDDVKHLYSGHEVAVHTLNHINLTSIDDKDEIIRQVEQDRINLSELAGYEVVGMAYPCGGVNCNDYVADIIKENTGVKYARTVTVTNSFEPYKDLYQYKGTLYPHVDWDKLFEMGREFLDYDGSSPKVFYIWGHSYEFDMFPERWESFEEFCKMISGKTDIFYGTNRDILLK